VIRQTLYMDLNHLLFEFIIYIYKRWANEIVLLPAVVPATEKKTANVPTSDTVIATTAAQVSSAENK